MADIGEHYCYTILYEDKDDHYDESELHIGGDGSLDMYISEAKKLKADGHKNVRVIEYVVVTREVARV